ncbi:hypothetical protein E2C01_102609 [Portunus trituberculatus]|uniref:Uncharacterized protein n=1 Tax=Portunus trituberculatus TaxID=210409 RepID=A0A5B7KD22_PORTR|nr:hypothetical protein [Portunus trituberculatus]
MEEEAWESPPEVPRGRNPLRTHPSPRHTPLNTHTTRSRDSSPNWSDVSDHSPPRFTPTAAPRGSPVVETRLEGRRSPLRGGRGRKPRGKPEGGDETDAATARMEMLCLSTQGLVFIFSLLQAVPMMLVTGAWQHQGPDVCPLYVSRPPGFGIHWGNEDLAPCKAAAFLPVLVAALSVTLSVSHGCVLHVWRVAGQRPVTKSSAVYARVTVVLVLLQVRLRRACVRGRGLGVCVWVFECVLGCFVVFFEGFLRVLGVF